MDSRSNPLAPNPLGDDADGGEFFGDDDPLKMDEGGPMPSAGSLDTAFPDTSPTEDVRSDPGLLAGSRDPDVAGSAEQDGWPSSGTGDTPDDAQGTAGSEGGR